MFIAEWYTILIFEEKN